MTKLVIVTVLTVITAIMFFWGAYSYELGFINKTIRYIPLFIARYPIQVLLIIIPTVTGIALFPAAYSNFKLELQPVAAFTNTLKVSGIHLDNTKSTYDLFTTVKAINASISNSAEDDRTIIEKMFKRYDDIYKGLPKKMKELDWITNNNLNFHKRTQFILVKVKTYQQCIYFIKHDADKPDRQITTINFNDLPTEVELQQIAGINFPSDRITEARTNLIRWHNEGLSIHTPSGYGQAGGSVEDIKVWLYGYMPYDLTKFDYRHFIADGMQLQNLVNQ